ncbi:MAG: hypothetical protein ACPKPY_00175 [Nitrososphaeraceae archaeon]
MVEIRTFKEWWENVHHDVEINRISQFKNIRQYENISKDDVNNVLLFLHYSKRHDLKPSLGEFKYWLNSGQLNNIV